MYAVVMLTPMGPRGYAVPRTYGSLSSARGVATRTRKAGVPVTVVKVG